MRYFIFILLLFASCSIISQAQDTILYTFKEGDHIYYMEYVYDPPIHYQVCGKINTTILQDLLLFGVPECVLAYDPSTKVVFPEWIQTIEQDNCVVILTPYLSRATSFKVKTNNRIFVFLTKPLQQTKL